MVEIGQKKECAILGFFDFAEGRIAAIDNLEEARRFSGVIDIQLDVKAGDIIKRASDDRSRCGYYIICADNCDQLYELERKIIDTIKVDIESYE